MPGFQVAIFCRSKGLLTENSGFRLQLSVPREKHRHGKPGFSIAIFCFWWPFSGVGWGGGAAGVYDGVGMGWGGHGGGWGGVG